MKTIWKYPIDVIRMQRVNMPFGAKIISAGTQGDGLFVWALVESHNSCEPKTIEVYGTGHEIMFPDGLIFVATVQDIVGGWVWHIFERE